MNDVTVPKEGGLTQKQKDYAVELMVRVSQGKAVAEDIKQLASIREKDEFGFIDMMLDSTLIHEDFNSDGAGVDNFHKNALIRIKLLDTKNKAVKSEKQVDVMSIDFINKLRGYQKPTDGAKFGDKRSTEIIDVSPPVEKTENFIEDD
jgi:hypothetical protein